MTPKKPDYRELVHSPADLGREHVAWAERLQGVPGVPFGVPCVDEKMVPMHPGDMVIFCGRPGSGKSSLLASLARAEGKRIVARGKADEEAVVYVTFEQVTEEMNAVLETTDKYSVTDIVRGRVDMDEVKRQATRRASMPIWLIGDSLARTGPTSPRMYPEVVFNAIESLRIDYGIHPTLVCVDYIQLVPIPRLADRQKQVIEAAHRVKELAKRIGCPAIVAVQARRDVDDRKVKIPYLHDAQWSSSIEQAADKFFGLWRPWITEPHVGASPIIIDDVPYPMTPVLLILAMRKQRFAEGNWTWGLHFRPEFLRLCAMERDIELGF